MTELNCQPHAPSPEPGLEVVPMDAGDQAGPVLEAGGSLAPRFTAGCQPPSASLCPPLRVQPPEGPLVWGLPCSARLVLWACAPPGLRHLFPTSVSGVQAPCHPQPSLPHLRRLPRFWPRHTCWAHHVAFIPGAAGGRRVLLRAGYTLVLGCSRLRVRLGF